MKRLICLIVFSLVIMDEAIPQNIGPVPLNLINNAFQACSALDTDALHASLYAPSVSISTKRVNEYIEIRITDNGIVISDEIKEKIFQPFFTTKATGQGTGLGLSLAYDIITKGHGGTIEVHSKENEGTEFLIQIPIINN